MTKFLLLYAVIAAMLTCGIPVLVERWNRRKWKKMYNSVQIGDKYIKNHREKNPFKEQWGSVITITGKAMNKYGEPYVKYLDGYIECSDSLSHLMEHMHYEPYNNQDKKQ